MARVARFFAPASQIGLGSSSTIRTDPKIAACQPDLFAVAPPTATLPCLADPGRIAVREPETSSLQRPRFCGSRQNGLEFAVHHHITSSKLQNFSRNRAV